MQLFAPDDPRPLHFMGVGGAGMSSLALLARRRGVTVTGCDIDPAGAMDVANAGAEIAIGHDAAHVKGARAVVHTAAVALDHPELQAARDAGIPVVRRADALHAVVESGTVVAIAGTHGKTTTTVMTTEALAHAGCHPTGLAGGRVASWGGNARLDGNHLFVVEADEYDRAFLALRPTVAAITNVEADHLECYGSVADLEAAFVEFAGRARHVVVGAGDRGALRVAGQLAGVVWRVGMEDDADVRVLRVDRSPSGTTGVVRFGSGREVPLRLSVPGLHNVRNAAVALAVVEALGHDSALAARGLERFVGVGRRFEIVGEARGVTVVDDYAHHPTEVTVTIAAARQRFPAARVVAVFQPHLYSRTKAHGDAFGIALSLADVVVVTEVYGARERPMAGVTGRKVAKAAERAGAETHWLPHRDALADRLLELARDGDVVLTMGAGDITDVGRELYRRLRGRAA
ncbi:MAG TPA: UDP-N-acetylmuramate--L-alanine ligase [Gemmatimonadales bacterium]